MLHKISHLFSKIPINVLVLLILLLIFLLLFCKNSETPLPLQSGCNGQNYEKKNNANLQKKIKSFQACCDTAGIQIISLMGNLNYFWLF